MLIEGLSVNEIVYIAMALLGVLAVVSLLWGVFQYKSAIYSRRLLNESEEHVRSSEQGRIQSELVVAKLEAELTHKNDLLDKNEEQLRQLIGLKERYIHQKAQLEEKDRQLHEQKTLLQDAKAVLAKEFELTANKLFEEKQQSFSVTSQQTMEQVLVPFKQQLQNFHKHVDDVYYKENTQRHQLIGQIGELQKQASKISDDANHLASALKGDNRIQGGWGEIVLERLLEQSGLQKGREFLVQNVYKNEEGKRYRPDVIIRLPDEKDIVIDSKMALVDYERYVREEAEIEKQQFLKQHVEAIRNHIKSLSVKEYQKLKGIRTLDFVFMFVPVEAAYLLAVQQEPKLFDEAYEKNILLVSPSNLMVSLRTVETMWRYERQNANAEKIAASAEGLYDQFVLVVKALEEAGHFIEKASDSHSKAMSRLMSGKGNVLRRVDNLRKLGVKPNRSLPDVAQQVLDSNEEGVDENAINENAVGASNDASRGVEDIGGLLDKNEGGQV